MDITAYSPGQISFVDLASPDLDEAAAFYSKLFGWTVLEMIPGPDGYRMFAKGDKIVAGLGPVAPDQRAGWLNYIAVSNADEAVERALAAGGSVVTAVTQVGEAGRSAVLSDPGGAVIAAWEPGKRKGADIINEPGAIAWNELLTPDHATAAAFYADVFGMTTEPMGPDYTIFKSGEIYTAGMSALNPESPDAVPGWSVVFAVEDTDGAAASAAALGGEVRVRPTDSSEGRYSLLADPQGATFSIIAPTALQEQSDEEEQPVSVAGG